MVISVPEIVAIPLQLIDLYTFNFAYIGSRETSRRQLPDRRAVARKRKKKKQKKQKRKKKKKKERKKRRTKKAKKKKKKKKPRGVGGVASSARQRCRRGTPAC